MQKENKVKAGDKQRVKALLHIWKVEITNPKMKKLCLEMYRQGAADQYISDQIRDF